MGPNQIAGEWVANEASGEIVKEGLVEISRTVHADGGTKPVLVWPGVGYRAAMSKT